MSQFNPPPGDPSQPPYDPQRYGSFPSPEQQGQGYNEPPATPHAWYGFIAFNIGLMLVGLYFLGLGVWCRIDPQGVLNTQQQSAMQPSSGAQTIDDILKLGIMFIIMGLMYFIIPGVMFLIPRSPVKWFYGLGVIALAFLGCCCAPFALPMIFFWMLPATRAYFWNHARTI